jgi:hypothetical protein
MSTKDGRLHLRHEQALLDRVKEIAGRRGVTVTFLVDQFFRGLVDEEERPKTDEELGIEQA